MKILFLVVSYHTINFFKPIIKDLESAGCRIKILAIDELPFGAKEDGWDTHRVDWHQFDWQHVEGFEPDRIVIFNGYFRKIHAASMMLKKKYPTFFAEVAWFPQGDYIYLDTDIHHKTKIAKVDIDFKTELVEKHHRILKGLRGQYNLPEKIPYDLPEEFILLPLQLERDTSIVYASDIFKDMNSLIGYVRNNSKGIHLVVKCHPKMATDEVEEQLKTIGVDTVITKTDVSVMSLINRATLTCGINSTCLMEALILHKRVLQFGNNIAHNDDVGSSLPFNYYKLFPNSVTEAFHDVRKKSPSEEEVEYMDRTVLHMHVNQIPFRNPPKWVSEKIINFDTSPRGIRDL